MDILDEYADKEKLPVVAIDNSLFIVRQINDQMEYEKICPVDVLKNLGKCYE